MPAPGGVRPHSPYSTARGLLTVGEGTAPTNHRPYRVGPTRAARPSSRLVLGVIARSRYMASDREFRTANRILVEAKPARGRLAEGFLRPHHPVDESSQHRVRYIIETRRGQAQWSIGPNTQERVATRSKLSARRTWNAGRRLRIPNPNPIAAGFGLRISEFRNLRWNRPGTSSTFGEIQRDTIRRMRRLLTAIGNSRVKVANFSST